MAAGAMSRSRVDLIMIFGKEISLCGARWSTCIQTLEDKKRKFQLQHSVEDSQKWFLPLCHGPSVFVYPEFMC